MADQVKPGDILATRSPGWTAAAIRIGAALTGKINLSNHVAIVVKTDAHGTLWVVEGKPGGVGWRQASDYLGSKWTITNADQPKTDAQRKTVCDTAVHLIGTAYDWKAIAADAAADLRQGFNWAPDWGQGQVPGQVVCSSLAAYAYDQASLARPPGKARTCQPGDWDTWCITRGWAHG